MEYKGQFVKLLSLFGNIHWCNSKLIKQAPIIQSLHMTSILSEVSVLYKKIISLTLPDILRLYIINCHLAFKSADCGFASVVGSLMFPPPLTKDAQVLIPEPVNRLPYVEREILQMW